MSDKTFLSWPFFDVKHAELAARLEDWAERKIAQIDHSDTDAACRTLIQKLGDSGWLDYAAVDPDSEAPLDVRSLCLIRETLARHDGLAAFSFAMQGLGTGAISLFGSKAQQQDRLPKIRSGAAISAFALTEPQSGSDVANSTMSATLNGDHYVLEGEKTWISNGGIADVYTVFARTGDGENRVNIRDATV